MQIDSARSCIEALELTGEEFAGEEAQLLNARLFESG